MAALSSSSLSFSLPIITVGDGFRLLSSSPTSSSKAVVKPSKSVDALFLSLKSVRNISEITKYASTLTDQEEPAILAFNIQNFLKQHRSSLQASPNIVFMSLQLKRLSLTFLKYMSHVEHITCIHTSITTLPKELGEFKNLTTLEIIHSEFNDVTSLCHLISLQHLRLNRNKFTSLPSNIGNLTNLKTLVCNGNQLKYLPPELSKLTRLEELHLDDNSFQAVPEVIFSLPNLKVVRLRGNPIALKAKETTDWIQTKDNSRKTLVIYL